MTIPINIMTDCEDSFKSRVDYLSLRSRFAKPERYRLHLTSRYRLGDNEKIPELTANIWGKFIDDTIWTHPIYTLIGGEPLLYPHITDVLTILGFNNSRIEIVTNGNLLNKYIDLMFKYNVKIIIGLEDIHKSNVRILEIIKDFKTEYYKNINFNLTISPENMEYVEQWLNNLMIYPIQSISFQQELKSLDLATNIEMNKFTDLLKQKFSKNSTKIIFLPITSFDNNVCLKPWLNPTIMPNGNILNCQYQVIGNITNNSIWEIWNEGINLKFREKLLNIHKFPYCLHCEDFYFKYEILYERVEKNE